MQLSLHDTDKKIRTKRQKDETMPNTKEYWEISNKKDTSGESQKKKEN